MNRLDSQGLAFPLSAFVKEVKDANKAKLLELLISRIALNALKSFQDKNFVVFDALVGETSCQLRAVKIVTLANLFDTYQEIRERITMLISGLDAGVSSISFTEDECFLILSHLLYLTRDQEKKTETNELNLLALCQGLSAHKDDLVSLVWKAKEELALSSVVFLRKVVPTLLLPANEKEMLLVQASSR